MNRCLYLASMALGNTSPNPMVGSVIVFEDRIIGEGYHTRAGNPHAEVMAINEVKEKHLLKKSELYVNLEPCSHFGRTPPCARRIIEEGIPRVIIGSPDPSDKVSGRGIQMLKEAGVEVKVAVLERENIELNKRFFTFHKKQRPYIILKWAQSADAYLDRIRSGNITGPNWITGMEERILVHKWRSQEDAILIGDKTACNDDPGLDVRYWKGENPRRFVLSENQEMPDNLKIFSGEPATVIFSLNNKKRKGADCYLLKSREDALNDIMKYFYDNEIQSVIVEGGYTVLKQFIDKGLWDEARVFRGNIIFGNGLKAPELKGKLTESFKFTDSCLEYYKPNDSRKEQKYLKKS